MTDENKLFGRHSAAQAVLALNEQGKEYPEKLEKIIDEKSLKWVKDITSLLVHKDARRAFEAIVNRNLGPDGIRLELAIYALEVQKVWPRPKKLVELRNRLNSVSALLSEIKDEARPIMSAHSQSVENSWIPVYLNLYYAEVEVGLAATQLEKFVSYYTENNEPDGDYILEKAEEMLQDIFESQHRVPNGFQKVPERWENRLTRKEIGLVDTYLDGRLVICIYYSAGRDAEYVAVLTYGGDERILLENDIFLKKNTMKMDPGQGVSQKQLPVLVDIVDFVHGPKGSIPFVASIFVNEVGFDVVNNGTAKIFTEPRYFSVTKFVDNIGPLFVKGETDEFSLLGGSEWGGNLEPCMIHCSAQAMDRISEAQREFGRHWSRLNEGFVGPGCGIMLQPGGVVLRHNVGLDGFMKLQDVAVGPVNL